MNKKIQNQWQNSHILAVDGVVYGDGSITLAQTYSIHDGDYKNIQYYFSPLVDCYLEGLEKYHDDYWLEIGIYNNSFIYNNQKIVFGDGCMGNEGFVASTTLDNQLNWSMFFDFSNPINKAEIIDDKLICYGDTGVKIFINLEKLHDVKIEYNFY